MVTYPCFWAGWCTRYLVTAAAAASSKELGCAVALVFVAVAVGGVGVVGLSGTIAVGLITSVCFMLGLVQYLRPVSTLLVHNSPQPWRRLFRRFKALSQFCPT